MKAILSVVCVLVLFLGCATKPPSALDDRSKFELVKIGMSKREVHKLFGKPKFTIPGSGSNKGGEDYYGGIPNFDPLVAAPSPTTIVIVYSNVDIVEAKQFFGEKLSDRGQVTGPEKREARINSNKTMAAPLSDHAEIGIAICEYIITNVVLRPPSARPYVHVGLDDQQRRLLQARVPQADIRPLDLKAIDRLCFNIRVDQIKIDVPLARAQATWFANRSFMTYDFDLSKTNSWAITNVAELRGSIAD